MVKESGDMAIVMEWIVVGDMSWRVLRDSDVHIAVGLF